MDPKNGDSFLSSNDDDLLNEIKENQIPEIK